MGKSKHKAVIASGMIVPSGVNRHIQKVDFFSKFSVGHPNPVKEAILTPTLSRKLKFQLRQVEKVQTLQGPEGVKPLPN